MAEHRAKGLSLRPLEFEEALNGLLQTEPPPDKKRAAPPQKRPSRGKSRSSKRLSRRRELKP